MSLESIIGQLKTEENKELRNELFKEYNKILDEKYKIYKTNKETNIIEHKLINEANVDLDDVVELDGEEKSEIST